MGLCGIIVVSMESVYFDQEVWRRFCDVTCFILVNVLEFFHLTQTLSIYIYIYRHKLKLFILSRLNDFVTCSVRFNIQSEGPISQL